MVGVDLAMTLEGAGVQRSEAVVPVLSTQASFLGGRENAFS